MVDPKLFPMFNPKAAIKDKLRPYVKRIKFPHNKGYCPICRDETVFFQLDPWLRDFYRCNRCESIPRNRALVRALERFIPDWENKTLHESSPGGPLSDFLKKHSKDYSASYYYEDVPRGDYRNGFRSEDISALTFPDNSIDVFITSDVFEHVIEPAKGFSEIARVLKPGGYHIFTMPWYPKLKTTVPRARLENNQIVYLEEPMYHGNPISEKGSLVTNDWGLDFCSFIYNHGGLETTIYLEKDKHFGLEAEFLEVFVSAKRV
jgi:Methyltransferase domain